MLFWRFRVITNRRCTEVPPLKFGRKETMSIYRELVESPRFTKERERFAPDAHRFDDDMGTVALPLSRYPERGACDVLGSYYVTRIEFSDGRAFAIYYTFDDNKVFLESLLPAQRDGASEPIELEWRGKTAPPKDENRLASSKLRG